MAKIRRTAAGSLFLEFDRAKTNAATKFQSLVETVLDGTSMVRTLVQAEVKDLE